GPFRGSATPTTGSGSLVESAAAPAGTQSGSPTRLILRPRTVVTVASCVELEDPHREGTRHPRRIRARRLSPRGAVPLVAALLLALARPASAGPKTDVVTLYNGNTLTCEIKLLQTGRLSASTDDLGTVNIEWD